MDGRKPFIPGFETEDQARAAGRKFYRKTNGRPGVEGVDFHLSRNKHDRWHFEEGRLPEVGRTDG